MKNFKFCLEFQSDDNNDTTPNIVQLHDMIVGSELWSAMNEQWNS